MEKLINEIKNIESVIICNKSFKDAIIEKINNEKKLINVKFKSYDEAIKDLLGCYKDLCYEISKKLNISLNYAKRIYDSFLLVDKAINDKTKQIMDLKEEYKKYYTFNEIVFDTYKNVYLVNYDDSNPLLNKALKKISYKKYNIKTNKKRLNLYEAKNQIAEVDFVANEIAHLLDKGINPNDIIVHYNKTYNDIIKYVFKNYNIDYSINDEYRLYDFLEVKKIIEALKTKDGLFNDDIKEVLKDYTQFKYYNDLINICNKLVIYNDNTKDIMDYFIYLITKKRVRESVKTNVINFSNYIDSYLENKYVFVMGCNQSVLPKIHTDSNYLTDRENMLLNNITSDIINKCEKEKTINLLNSSYIVSYPLNTKNGKMTKSRLLNEYEINKIDNSNVKYSYNQALINNVSKLDLYKKYNVKSDELYKYMNTFKGFEYDSYDNSFKGIDNEKINKKIGDLKVSYSSLDTFYRCHFRYYLEKVLKLPTPQNDSAYVGSLFHYVLSEIVDNDVSYELIDNKINEYIRDNQIELDNLKRIYLNTYKNILFMLISDLKDNLSSTKFLPYGNEMEFKKYIDDVLLEGKIDRIFKYVENGKEYVMVVDYKTGSDKPDLNYLTEGIGMQLLIYLILLDEYEFGGMYLQRILPTKFEKKNDFTIEQLYKEYIRLDGYTNINKVYQIDNKIDDGSFILGGNTRSGKSKNRFITTKEVKELKKIVYSKIEEAINLIRNGKFSINPISINDSECEYCSFRGICYRKNKDIIVGKKINIIDEMRAQDGEE